jgi:WXG100 family type VII secretion target
MNFPLTQGDSLFKQFEIKRPVVQLKESNIMADEVKADYDQLEQIANRFGNQSEEIQDMLQQVRSSMEKLESDWIGRGSEAFFREMQGEVLPAVQRLQQALQEANRVTKEIVQTMQEADEEASSPFRSNT